MNIQSLCRKDVITIRAYASLISAARAMREKHVGYLVVTEMNPLNGAHRPVGVLTDRDIVTAVIARERNPQAVSVEQIMTRQPQVLDQELTVAEALSRMRNLGVRRMPVVDPKGYLVGVLSLDEVLDALATQLTDAAAAVRKEVMVEQALRN